jgi:hypothetical protein
MTLIEVLAGLVVLGTVLASVTIARGRFMQQTVVAQQKLLAVQAADELVSSWLSSPAGVVDVPAQGVLRDSLAWRARQVVSRDAEALGVRMIHVDVLEKHSRGRLLLSLEFVAPQPRASSASTQPSERP